MADVRYGMVVDLRKCIGCHTCSVACKMENAVPLGVWRSWVKQVEKGRFPYVRKTYLPMLCNNCENPICVTVCPVKASYRRKDGIVLVDPHRCIGCRYCMAVCPYDARYVNPRVNIVEKCYWCDHLVDQGMKPACVDACPTQARIFGDINDHNNEIGKVLVTNPVQVIKPEMGTYPKVFYIEADLDALRTAERKE
jgi:tetrathionate reductase subunit B